MRKLCALKRLGSSFKLIIGVVLTVSMLGFLTFPCSVLSIDRSGGYMIGVGSDRDNLFIKFYGKSYSDSIQIALLHSNMFNASQLGHYFQEFLVQQDCTKCRTRSRLI
jgi:hypothetical protein